MSVDELMPAIQALLREEKQRLLRLLTDELAQEDPLLLIPPGHVFEIWSPYDCYGAAAALQEVLENAEKQK